MEKSENTTLSKLIMDNLTDYKIRSLKDVIIDQLERLHDDLNEGITDARQRDIFLNRSNNIYALFEILYDILPQMPDYFEQVNMKLEDYKKLLTDTAY